jgi:hypothetical protein
VKARSKKPIQCCHDLDCKRTLVEKRIVVGRSRHLAILSHILHQTRYFQFAQSIAGLRDVKLNESTEIPTCHLQQGEAFGDGGLDIIGVIADLRLQPA